MRSLFYLAWGFFLILTLVSCGKKEAHKTTRYYSFQGEIGSGSSIHFHLLFKNDKITGHYAYDLIGIPLPLSGKLQGNHFTLDEIGPYGKTIARLSGTYNPSSYSLAGIWQDTGHTTTLPFFARIRPKEQALRVEAIAFHETDSPKNAPSSSIHIQSLYVKSKQKNIAQRINKNIQECLLNAEIYGTSYKDIPHFLSSLHYNIRKNALHINIDCWVQNNTQQLFGIKVRHRIVHSLNKYPVELTFYYNFNTHNGEEIVLSDLIDKENLPELNQIARRILFTMHERDTSFLSAHPFRLNHNFALTSGGLLFLFNPYEYKTAFPVELFIPFSEISAILKQEQIQALFPENYAIN